MDLDEWELLPDEGFLEINEDGGGNKIYSRKYLPKGSSTAHVFQMNYFKSTTEFAHNPSVPLHHQHLLPVVPIDLQPEAFDPRDDDQRVVKQVTKVPVGMINVTPPPSEMIVQSRLLPAPDQDPVSQVFFKKIKETEFVDIKVDSPKSGTAPTSTRGIMPQIEGTGAFQFEDKGSEAKVDSETPIKHDENMELDLDLEQGEEEEEEEGGLNVWKWSLTGIGAICSFGVAAATFCIIVFSGSHHKNRHPHHNRKLQFQIYSNDKRMKQVVQQASKINEALSAVRGVPITRAHITFGGYYDASL